MKKIAIYSILSILIFQSVYAADTFFDSMDDAQEVKLAPPIKASSSASQAVVSNNASSSQSIKEEKFNNALTNLDDAQVELRQDLAELTAQYNEALGEKERVIANCKSLKKEINAINKKMKNIDKSKKIINKSIDSPQ